jgi:tetratricopeptide (TPR) repeat protein
MSAASQPWTDAGTRAGLPATGEILARGWPFVGRWSRSLLWLCPLVVLAAALPYLNALPADFTFDDVGLIRDNAAVQVLPASGLLAYVYYPGGLYRPLTMLTYAANVSLSPAPMGFHLVNVLVHVLVSVAVLFLARALLGSIVAAAGAALLFAVHPIHTEAVTSVVGRAELLAALGVLVALLAYRRAALDSGLRRQAWSAVALLAFAAALLAKESAFTALGLLVVVHWCVDRSASLRQRIMSLLPFAAVAAGYLALRLAVVGTLGLPEAVGALDNPLAHTDTATRMRTAVIILWQYMEHLTVPIHLSADYSFNQIPLALSWSDPRFLRAALLCTALAAAILVATRRAPLLAVAALFTLIPLILTANILFPIGTIKAERLLYLPSVGWCLAVGWLAARTAARHAPAAALTLLVLITAFGVRAWVRNDDWRDENALYAATVSNAPASAKAHHNAAVALERAGRLDDATVEFRETLEIYPNYASAAFGIGHIYAAKGIRAGAVHWYEQALHQDPRFVKAHLQLGLLHAETRDLDTAEAAFRSGLEIEPRSPLLLVNLAAIRLAQGDRWGAQAIVSQLDHVGTVDAEERELVAAARREIEAELR